VAALNHPNILAIFDITPDGKAYAYSLYRDFTDLYLVKGLK
jgi:hypothetical protein